MLLVNELIVRTGTKTLLGVFELKSADANSTPVMNSRYSTFKLMCVRLVALTRPELLLSILGN